MKTYQLHFSDGRGDRTASGTVFCHSDDAAAASAQRLLRTMSYFDTVQVREGQRPVAALERRDLEVAA